MKLTKRELTKAIAQYARRHNCYARTVRAVTVLFNAAIREYRSRMEGVDVHQR